GDLKESNRRLTNQRKAMRHILVVHEKGRQQLAFHTKRLDKSRRALLHLLKDSHSDRLRLEASRKATIHILGDLQKTTIEMRQRETRATRQPGAVSPSREARHAWRARHWHRS